MSEVRRMIRAGIARQVLVLVGGEAFYNKCHGESGRFCPGGGGGEPYAAQAGRAVAGLQAFHGMGPDPVWLPFAGLSNTQKRAIGNTVHKQYDELQRSDYVWGTGVNAGSVLSAAKTLHVVYRLHQIGLGGLVAAGGRSGELFDLVNEKRPVGVKHFTTGMDEYVYRTSISGMYFAVGIDRADGRIKTAYPTNLALPPVNPRRERSTKLDRERAKEIISQRGGVQFLGADEGSRLTDSERKKLDRYVHTDFSYASKIQQPHPHAVAAAAGVDWRKGFFVLLTGEGYSVFDSGVLVGVFDSLDGAKSFVAGGGGSNE